MLHVSIKTTLNHAASISIANFLFIVRLIIDLILLETLQGNATNEYCGLRKAVPQSCLLLPLTASLMAEAAPELGAERSLKAARRGVLYRAFTVAAGFGDNRAVLKRTRGPHHLRFA